MAVSSLEHPVLDVYFYKNQFQLATSDALYSDGTRYQPLLQGLRQIKKDLPKIENMLVLGAGLGSAVSILDKMGFYPTMTLLDNDEVILKMSNELMDYQLRDNIALVCEDAASFIKKNEQKFDLIIIDIFKGRVVPDFAVQKDFLVSCKRSLSRPGYIIMNYMINSKKEWIEFQGVFNLIFSNTQIIEIGINRVMIARV